MRNRRVLTVAMVGLLSAPAAAQGVFANGKACYDPSFRIPERVYRSISVWIDASMAMYVAKARAGGNLDDLYFGKREERHWTLDGVEVDPRSARDPWITASTRLQPTEYLCPNSGCGPIMSRWNLVAADGTILGAYEAMMVVRARRYALKEIHLYSPAKAALLQPLKTFCVEPGDIEKRIKQQALRGAEKAASR